MDNRANALSPPSRPPEDGGRRQLGFRGTKQKSAGVKLSPGASRPFTARAVVRLPGREGPIERKKVLPDFIFTRPFTNAVVSPLGGRKGGSDG